VHVFFLQKATKETKKKSFVIFVFFCEIKKIRSTKSEIRNPGETKKIKVSQGRQIKILKIQMTKTKD